MAFFSGIYNDIFAFWNQVIYAIKEIRFFDIIDIIVVAYLLYKVLVFLRETRAGQLAKGIVVMIVLYALANWWKLSVLQWILSVIFSSAIVVLAIIFQPELRRILEQVGQTNWRGGKVSGEGAAQTIECIESIGKAARIMQESKTGALIVFERKTQLGEIINTGTVIDANTSVSMITNIFYPKAPLHDGAVIIRDGRIFAAGCILPLTQNNNFSHDLGTRHRAAIGMTENSDAVVLVISEETGNISIVKNGEITRGYSGISAAERLMELLVEKDGSSNNYFADKIRSFTLFGKAKESEEENKDETSK